MTKKVLTKKECIDWLQAHGYSIVFKRPSRLWYITKNGDPMQLTLFASLQIVRRHVQRAMENPA